MGYPLLHMNSTINELMCAKCRGGRQIRSCLKTQIFSIKPIKCENMKSENNNNYNDSRKHKSKHITATQA